MMTRRNNLHSVLTDCLTDYLAESWLIRLVWQYARAWTTLVLDMKGQGMLATTGGTEWWRPPRVERSFNCGVSATWHDGAVFVLDGAELWQTRPLPAGSTWQLCGKDALACPRLLVSASTGLYTLTTDCNGVLRYDKSRSEDARCWWPCAGTGHLSTQRRLRHWTGHAVLDDHVFLVGGMGSFGSTSVSCVFLSPDDTLRLAMVETNWEDALQRTRSYCNAVACNVRGLVYVAGGRADNTVECFDPRTGTSTLLPPMQYERWGPSIALGDSARELFVIGGAGSGTSIEAFSFCQGTWRLLPVTCPYVEDKLTVHRPEMLG
jgi:hypothetical protein